LSIKVGQIGKTQSPGPGSAFDRGGENRAVFDQAKTTWRGAERPRHLIEVLFFGQPHTAQKCTNRRHEVIPSLLDQLSANPKEGRKSEN
jgi:hypothetical protein